jgi:CTP synthase (UTP-ammonia lyase)
MTTIVVLGDRNDEILTHREIDAALSLFPDAVQAGWVTTGDARGRDLTDVDGLWVAPGGPYESDAAVHRAIEWCLDEGTPFLGTCSGFQYACMTLIQRTGGEAVHAEVDPGADSPAVAPLACSLYGQERTVTAVEGTIVGAACGTRPFPGFHFCGYGLAADHEAAVERAGAVISARAPDVGVEAIELPAHPFFVATAFQPQVGASGADRLHPLLDRFVERAVAHAEAGRRARAA